MSLNLARPSKSHVAFGFCVLLGLVLLMEHKINYYNYNLLTAEHFTNRNHTLTSIYTKDNLQQNNRLQENDDSTTTTVPATVKDKCGMGKELVGRLYVNKEKLTWETLHKDIVNIQLGGRWSPSDCTPIVKMALIIPYRDREEHLKVFLRQINPVLQRQRISYQIFVIEQLDKSNFNRGKLMNVGYREALNYGEFNCFVFHDVDLIPEDDRNYYGCHKSPMHLSVAVDKFNYQLTYDALFGGIEMFRKEDFEKINGFSNIFWGWGAEDDNLYQRLGKNGLTLKRPAIEKARYQMIKHSASKREEKRFHVMNKAIDVIGRDGLNSLQYSVLDRIQHSLYMKIQVDLKEASDKIIKEIDLQS